LRQQPEVEKNRENWANKRRQAEKIEAKGV
jgi:hypothetical protein